MTSPPLNQTSPPLPLAAIKAMRPKQWAKNVFIFAALIFSLNFENPTAIYQTLMALCSFCCISSSGYIINDIRDIEVDRNHPKKQFRPLASGALPVNIGYTQAALLFCLGMIFGYSISLKLLVVALAYFTTTMSYSLFFKNIVVLDVMFIASGFIWRVVAGAVAINVAISPWLLTCTGFLALFLGFNKRRGELISMKDKNTRNNLKDYNIPMLQEFQAITTSGAIISYAIYTVLGPHNNQMLLLTLPYVVYGIFRYIFLINRHGAGDAPDETLLKDIPIIITGLLYICTAIIIFKIYPE